MISGGFISNLLPSCSLLAFSSDLPQQHGRLGGSFGFMYFPVLSVIHSLPVFPSPSGDGSGSMRGAPPAAGHGWIGGIRTHFQSVQVTCLGEWISFCMQSSSFLVTFCALAHACASMLRASHFLFACPSGDSGDSDEWSERSLLLLASHPSFLSGTDMMKNTAPPALPGEHPPCLSFLPTTPATLLYSVVVVPSNLSS